MHVDARGPLAGPNRVRHAAKLSHCRVNGSLAAATLPSASRRRPDQPRSSARRPPSTISGPTTTSPPVCCRARCPSSPSSTPTTTTSSISSRTRRASPWTCARGGSLPARMLGGPCFPRSRIPVLPLRQCLGAGTCTFVVVINRSRQFAFAFGLPIDRLLL
jgi:hypothetical protein